MKKNEKLDAMWKHLCELNNNILSFKLITTEEAVGKKTVKVMEKWLGSYTDSSHHIVILFDDNTALYYDGSYFSTYPLIYDSHCSYSQYQNDIDCWACMRDFGDWMISEGYIKQEDANILLETAKEYRRAQYQADLDETIQAKLEEIKELQERQVK